MLEQRFIRGRKCSYLNRIPTRMDHTRWERHHKRHLPTKKAPHVLAVDRELDCITYSTKGKMPKAVPDATVEEECLAVENAIGSLIGARKLHHLPCSSLVE
jgi:hypothetical protein